MKVLSVTFITLSGTRELHQDLGEKFSCWLPKWSNCRTTSNISFHLCACKIRHLTVVACLKLTVGFNLVPRVSLFPIRASREGREGGGEGLKLSGVQALTSYFCNTFLTCSELFSSRGLTVQIKTITKKPTWFENISPMLITAVHSFVF